MALPPKSPNAGGLLTIRVPRFSGGLGGAKGSKALTRELARLADDIFLSEHRDRSLRGRAHENDHDCDHDCDDNRGSGCGRVYDRVSDHDYDHAHVHDYDWGYYC